MPDKTHIDGVLGAGHLYDLVPPRNWTAIRNAFPGAAFDDWSGALADLAAADLGTGAILSFAEASPALARSVGVDAAMAVIPAALAVARATTAHIATELLGAAPAAARRLGDPGAFARMLETVAMLAAEAPESVPAVLARLDFVLASLDGEGFRRWALTGLRYGGGSAGARLRYFTLEEGDTLRVFDQETGAVTLNAVDTRLRAFLGALWGIWPILRPAGRRSVFKPIRRASFDARIIRMPETFPGFAGDEAGRIFKASVAHIGAHMMFTERFALRSLKPLQVALISLVEDARVEHLAMAEFPGLARLWRPFHRAEADALRLSLPMMARLSRALIDPSFQDDDPWVRKGREMFFDSRRNWHDQSVSRSIGGLLGNDLGQMRIQFNPRTYVVQPAYRDDNLGIWDYGEPDADASDEADTIYESARIVQSERPDDPHRLERTEEDAAAANRASLVSAVDEDVGVPVASYPEWDYVLGRERHDWTTVVEYEPRLGPRLVIDRIHQEFADVLGRIGRLVRSARVSRPVRLRRQPEGDRLDLDATIGATIDRRAGIVPDPRVYETSALRYRDLSVLLLLDISESTKDLVRGAGVSVFSLERAAATLLAEAMTGAGDPFALHAFSSNGRSEVRYVRMKDFGEPYSDRVKARLAGLRGGFSTRMGAALRHAGADLARQRTHRRLLLIVTDGEPSDVDVPDRKYLVEDARKAVQELAHRGLDVYCVGLDSGGDSYLSRIFGRRNVLQIDRVAALPERLPMLYFRLSH